jgi:hypothetical protein
MSSKERTLGTRATIFRRTDQGIPELDQRPTDAGDVSIRPLKQPRIKATFYLNPEDVLAIDFIQSEEFREKGKKPERSEIVSWAIQAYKEQRGL